MNYVGWKIDGNIFRCYIHEMQENKISNKINFL